MSAPGAEPAPAAETALSAAGPAGPAGPDAAAAGGRPDDPRLPWQGKPRAADILCWLGIVASGLLYWALLPLRLSLTGSHPVVAELLNGGTEAIISAAAFARIGHGTLAVAVLAAIPGLMKADPLYWWAGRLWGERFLAVLPGSRRAARHLGRVRRAGRKVTWPAVVVSSFLPVPRAVVYVVVGWAGMRLVTFLVLDLVGSLLWAGTLSGLGYALGHRAVAAAAAITRYSWWIAIGILVLTVALTIRSQARQRAAVARAGRNAE